MWDVGFGMWDVRCGIAKLGTRPKGGSLEDNCGLKSKESGVRGTEVSGVRSRRKVSGVSVQVSGKRDIEAEAHWSEAAAGKPET
jgi:hypothetical protein